MEGMRPSRQSIVLTSAALLAVVALTGCVPTEPDAPVASPTVTSTPSPTASATPAPEPTAETIPFDMACDQLITPEELYGINPNLGLLGTFEPDAGTPAAAVVAAGGVACRWTHTSNGESFDVAVAELPASVATALKNTLVVDSNSVPTYEVEGYFRVNGTNGEADAFPDPYWVSIVSPAFAEPGDAARFMAAVRAALG